MALSHSNLLKFTCHLTLTGPNYVDWFESIWMLLTAEKVISVLDEEEPPLPAFDDHDAQSMYVDWKKRDYKASMLILGSIGKIVLLFFDWIKDIPTAAGKMESISELFGKSQPDACYELIKDIHNAKLSSSSSMFDHLKRMIDGFEKLEDMGEMFTLWYKTNVILASLSQQLQDLNQFKGISHYEGIESKNHSSLPCPGELLVEEHHSNYGEPWAGGRDVFEFLADSVQLRPEAHVLEIGCGTLRVGLHFIRYLDPEHFHCLEKDELSLMAAFRYELPSQGLLYKRPLIVKGDDMELSRFGSGFLYYDLIYASAVFLHIPDNLVWVGLERLVTRLKPYEGRIFVSHNIKFCLRLGGKGVYTEADEYWALVSCKTYP